MKMELFKDKRKFIAIIFSVFVLLSMGFCAYRINHFIVNGFSKSTLVLYKGPVMVKQAEDTKISVNNNDLFVYNSPVNNTHTWVDKANPPMAYTPMTYFDFQGKVKIKIQLNNIDSLSKVKVTPISAGITPRISGKTITFFIENPGQYTVEYNNSVNRAIHIFANPLEKDVPDKNDKNVLYIGPGLWNVDNINLESGQTLYIAGGAVVNGTVQAKNIENVIIKGRGIIDGSPWPSWTNAGQTAKVPINIESSKNINVDGIILMNPNAWTFNALSSENAKINNIKIISARQNADGITLQSCRNFDIENCFVRTWDDSLVVKNYEGNSDNIIFNNINVWTDLAQSCEIGYETNKGNREGSIISNITFKNITVLHNFHKPVISIHNSDEATVQDINYKNIVVEDAKMGQGYAGTNNQLIDFNIMASTWSSTIKRGHIKNINVDNVKIISGKLAPSRIIGFDEEHMIENVNIKGLNILGKDIKSAKTAKLTTNEFVKNLIFK